MPDTPSLTLTRTLRAAPAEALRGFTHATLLRDWLADIAATDPRAGGHFFVSWHAREDALGSLAGNQFAGRYTQLDLPRSLAFTWSGADLPAPTLVTVTAQPVPDGTQLTLVHSGLGELQAASWNTQWAGALENLQSVLEIGVDLRVVRRPRLGILMDELTPAAVERLGLPVKEGVLLHGTAENSGAQAAGLQKDDVLVSLNGAALRSPTSFEAALRGLHAGDCPVVEFYRGGEKQTVALQLGRFPIPEYPATALGLSEMVCELYAVTMTNLRQQLAGLTEAQAERRPAQDEWSVKELVAHLILTDRDYQSWVADMLNDLAVEDWLQMSPNVTPRIQALVARMVSLDRLLDELEATLRETADMIAAFPESFARERKHLYRRAAAWASEVTPSHYSEEHLEQFQHTIAAAQKN
jgi:uncharacterized protein YndB with AHSA1/START domain